MTTDNLVDRYTHTYTHITHLFLSLLLSLSSSSLFTVPVFFGCVHGDDGDLLCMVMTDDAV